MGAGRTDAGVHARQQFAHFDWRGPLPDRLLHGVNAQLPASIVVSRLFRCVRPDFDARWDAIRRTYQYHLVYRPSPFNHMHALHLHHLQRLDVPEMERATRRLMQQRDFGAFCKKHGANKTTLCDLFSAEFRPTEDGLIFEVSANRFLRGMVRAMVGTLLDLGAGKISFAEFDRILESGDRSQAGKNIEAYGLFLHRVEYPRGWLAPLARAWD